MERNETLIQCDHCEIVLSHKLNDKTISEKGCIYNADISKGDKAFKGTYCSVECLANEVVLKLSVGSPVFSDRAKAISSLLERLQTQQDVIYQKHGKAIPEAQKKVDEAQDQLKQAGELSIPSALPND